jgi:hypothetical protein
MNEEKKCKCGCGCVMTRRNQESPLKWKKRRYLARHHYNDPDYHKSKGVGIKLAHDAGRFAHLIGVKRLEVSEKMKGRIVSESTRKKLSAASTGRKLSESHRITAVRNLRVRLTDEQEARRRKSVSIQRKGTHGYGKTAINNPKHFKAKIWRIRSPFGKHYEFSNLQAWARENESLFMPDQRPESRLPLWRRAVGGFNDMDRRDNKGQHHWRGWTLVGKEQQEADVFGSEIDQAPKG